MAITIYGIKNCDSVKKARKLLDTQGVQYNFHDFRDDGIDKKLVGTFIRNIDDEKLLNKRSTTWKQLSAAEQVSATDDLQGLLLEHPTLIKRPVIDANGEWLLAPKPDTLLASLQR